MKNAFHRAALTALVVATLGLTGSAFAQVDLTQSKVSAVAKQMNVPTEGVFKKFTADIKFDPTKPAQAHAAVTIDVASYDLGDAAYNAQVTGADWFDTKDFPQARFTSTAVTPAGANHFNVAGTITIKGKTVPVTVPMTVTQAGAKQVFDGVLNIKRSTFNVGAGEWKDTSVVADEVQIKFHIVAAK